MWEIPAFISITEQTNTRSRPSWDEYFLVLACTVSLRSEDPDIQHGAVIVNEYNHIIGTGYNGPVKGSDNSVIPFSVRDEKRKWMIHAEENAMLNVTQSSSERGFWTRKALFARRASHALRSSGVISSGDLRFFFLESRCSFLAAFAAS
jgi:tRNA(Arg) A34 adenosine deaminase TadA